MSIDIRPESSSDEQAIAAVHRASFPTAAEAALVDALRAAGRLSASLVASHAGEVVGHVAFSPVTAAGAGGGAGLAPVAVLSGFRRRGIAERLIRAGLAECERSGTGFVVVLGEPDYYRRFGFAPATHRGLFDEYGAGDAFQVVELRAGAVPPRGGIVHYAPEFRLLEPGGG